MSTNAIDKTTETGLHYKLLANDSGIIINNWTITSHASKNISNSIELDEFNDKYHVKPPEMCYLDNNVTIQYKDKFRYSFNTKQALLGCIHEQTTEKKTHTNNNTNTKSGSTTNNNPIQVSHAKSWVSNKVVNQVPADVDVKTMNLQYDWTYTTNYKGNVEDINNNNDNTSNNNNNNTNTDNISPYSFVSCSDNIPISLLQRADPILYYNSILLYEDELHDNGISNCSVKLRVMESCFLILLQYWLRVDQVCVRVYETRLFHQFNNNNSNTNIVLLREHTRRDETFDSLISRGMPRNSNDYIDPNFIAKKLPIKLQEKEKLEFQT